MSKADILNRILETKLEEIRADARSVSLATLRAESEHCADCRGFLRAIRDKVEHGHNAIIAEAKKAEREDLIDENEAEIAVLEVFLPEALSEDELRDIVKAAITETGASSPADMGTVMKAAMPKVAGRAPGGEISALAKELLAG